MATEKKESKARMKKAAPSARQPRERDDEAIIIRIDGRMYRRGAQTTDPGRATLMRAWIQDMKRGEYGGMDTLRHIVSQRVPLGEAYDRREAPAKVKSMGGTTNIEPLVDQWFAWKSDPAASAARSRQASTASRCAAG